MNVLEYSMNKERKGLMSGKLEEPLIKSLNRKAVASQSPGLPRFGGYPGKGRTIDPTPTGLRQPDATQKDAAKRTRRNLFEGGIRYRSVPRSRQSAATRGKAGQTIKPQ